MKRIIVLLAATALAFAQVGSISGERIRAHVKFLSSDLLEGRGAGLARRRSRHGVHRHAVCAARPETGRRSRNVLSEIPAGRRRTAARLGSRSRSAKTAGRATLQMARRFRRRHLLSSAPMRSSMRPRCSSGHGIVAPEYQWDDYQGIDVRGKVVVLFTGEPPSNDPKFFTGRRAHLLRPLDLQIRRSHAPRSGRRHHHPHDAHGQLRLGSGAILVGTRRPGSEAGSRRAGAGVRRLGDQRRRREDRGDGSARRVDAMLLKARRRARFPRRPLRVHIRGRAPAKVRTVETAT